MTTIRQQVHKIFGLFTKNRTLDFNWKVSQAIACVSDIAEKTPNFKFYSQVSTYLANEILSYNIKFEKTLIHTLSRRGQTKCQSMSTFMLILVEIRRQNETLEIEKFQSKDEPCCVYRVIPSFLRLSQNSEIENEVSCCLINFTTKFRYFVSRIWHANSKKLNQALLTSTKRNILREQNMVFWKFAICQFYFKTDQYWKEKHHPAPMTHFWLVQGN